MAAKQMQAKCLCGGVRIDADLDTQDVGVCHCDTCRRWAGGPFMAIEASENVIVAGTDLLGIYESSGWGERGFCNRCGSTLFWRSKDASHYAISAMAFDDLSEAVLTQEIFIDSKPDWYSFANETKTMTGSDFLAQFASAEDKPNG